MKVNFNNEYFLDTVKGEVWNDKSKLKSKGGEIPFYFTLKIRRFKPSDGIKKKIGAQWIGSKKLSYTFLLAYYLMTVGKNKIACFYPMVESHGRFLYIEIMVQGATIMASYKVIEEPPAAFLEIEAKYYDMIAGNVGGTTNVITTTIPFEKIHAEIIRTISPAQMVVVIVVALSLLTGAWYYKSEIARKAEEMQKIAMMSKPKQAEVDENLFTRDEVIFANKMMSKKLIEELINIVVDAMAKKDVALKHVTMHMPEPSYEGIKSIDGSVKVAYISYYPMVNSKIYGNLYKVKDEKTMTFLRPQVKKAMADGWSDAPPMTTECLEFLIKNRHLRVISRTASVWEMEHSTAPLKFKETMNFLKFANSCREVTITSAELSSDRSMIKLQFKDK